MASRKHHELYFKVDNRTAVSTVASKTRCPSKISRSTHMLAIATSFVRAAACYLAPRYTTCKMAVGGAKLEEGAVISVEGVTPSVGACGTGNEEDGVGGVWIT